MRRLDFLARIGICVGQHDIVCSPNKSSITTIRSTNPRARCLCQITYRYPVISPKRSRSQEPWRGGIRPRRRSRACRYAGYGKAALTGSSLTWITNNSTSCYQPLAEHVRDRRPHFSGARVASAAAAAAAAVLWSGSMRRARDHRRHVSPRESARMSRSDVLARHVEKRGKTHADDRAVSDSAQGKWRAQRAISTEDLVLPSRPSLPTSPHTPPM